MLVDSSGQVPAGEASDGLQCCAGLVGEPDSAGLLTAGGTVACLLGRPPSAGARFRGRTGAPADVPHATILRADHAGMSTQELRGTLLATAAPRTAGAQGSLGHPRRSILATVCKAPYSRRHPWLGHKSPSGHLRIQNSPGDSSILRCRRIGAQRQRRWLRGGCSRRIGSLTRTQACSGMSHRTTGAELSRTGSQPAVAQVA
jgi:hypothetical protein